MQDRTIRFLNAGEPPKNLVMPTFEMSPDEVYALGSGGGKVPREHTISVNGKNDPNARVVPGDTVQVQPLAWNG